MNKPSSFSQSSSHRNVLGVLAMMAFVLVNVVDIHSHFCLDGQEPAVSLHFENLQGHPEHQEEDDLHNDYESELSVKTLLAKSKYFSDFLPLASISVIFALIPSDTPVLLPGHELILFPNPAVLSPPLRAPPLTA